MFQTTTIHSEWDGAVELSCFINDGKYEDAWIEFSEIPDEEYPEYHLSWDNSSYLFDTFYPFLLRWKDRQTLKEDREEFKDVWDYLESDEDIVPELIEMFDLALKQGWYEYK